MYPLRVHATRCAGNIVMFITVPRASATRADFIALKGNACPRWQRVEHGFGRVLFSFYITAHNTSPYAQDETTRWLR